MATLAQLQRGGSQVLMPDGSFKFVLDLPPSKFKWDDKRLIRKVGEARVKALRAAGLVVKDRTKRGIGLRKPRQLKNAKRVPVGQRFGLSLIALIDRVPKAETLTSWKTPRFSKGMLKQDIQSDYDMRSKTVVIGPSKFPAINEMHEKGGTARRWFKPIPKRARGDQVFGILTNTVPRGAARFVTINGRTRRRRGREITSSYSFQIRIKPRAYMAKGLAKGKARIPEEFRDLIRGP